MAHTVIKPEVLILDSLVALDDKFVLPNLMTKQGIEKYVGAKDDTINITVDGVLPYRTYGWRNDRSASLTYDEYTERKVSRSFGDDIYSAVYLTDEQAKMDKPGILKVAGKQVEAIGAGLEVKATRAVQNAPYEVQVQLDEANLRGSLVKLKGVFDKLKVPGERTLIVGDDLEVALLDDDKLNLAQNVGEAEAVSGLRDATLGRRYKFNFVKGTELDSDEAYGIFQSGFIFLNASPDVPDGVPFAATASVNGFTLRWIKMYDPDKLRDRSIFNNYFDFHYIDDPIRRINPSSSPVDQLQVSTANHFVRGVKVTVGTGYKLEVSNTELETFTGLASTDGTPDGDFDTP